MCPAQREPFNQGRGPHATGPLEETTSECENTMNNLSEDDIFNSIGTTGGVILACALIPQIVLAHKRRSAEDISYMWQVGSVGVGVRYVLMLL